MKREVPAIISGPELLHLAGECWAFGPLGAGRLVRGPTPCRRPLGTQLLLNGQVHGYGIIDCTLFKGPCILQYLVNMSLDGHPTIQIAAHNVTAGSIVIGFMLRNCGCAIVSVSVHFCRQGLPACW